MPSLMVLASIFVLWAGSGQARTLDPSQCKQVRHAVARYGYAAAKRYGLVHYGPKVVKAGEQCLHRSLSHRRPRTTG